MECSICLIDDNHTFLFKHTCGQYFVHQSCLQQWSYLHPHICFICRQPIPPPPSFLSYLLFGPRAFIFSSFFLHYNHNHNHNHNQYQHTNRSSILFLSRNIFFFYLLFLSLIYLNKHLL